MKKNKLNERGSTLVLVLIVILVFSVLGVALIGNSVNERKRIDTTEVDGQARVLAHTGIDYFESQAEQYLENTPIFTSEQLFSFFDNYNATWDENFLEGVKMTVERDGFDVKVISQGSAGSKAKTVTAHYRIGFDIDKPTYEIADFTEEGTVATNFADDKILGLNLGLLGLGLLNPTGGDQKFYQVPADEVISVKLLGPILGVGISGDGFKTYRDTNVVATREFTVLGVDLLGGTLSRLVTLNLLGLQNNDDTNVVINGSTTYLTLLGIKINSYSDIEFKKFAVIGNTLIQQDRDGTSWLSTKDKNDRRRFTFEEGLFTNRSIIIGGEQDRDGKPTNWENFSKLMLRGDMVAMDNLTINYVDLVIGDDEDKEGGFDEDDYVTNMYVHGDVHIHDAGIRLKNNKYDLGIYTKGKITLENYTGGSNSNTFNGLFYAENGIEIKTHGKDMYINGGLAGNVTVDYPNKLHYTIAPEYMDKIDNIKFYLKKSADD